MEPIPEDMVTLDSLMGVAYLGQDQAHSFVKYRFTEKHKACGVLKINRVEQINIFIQRLRDEAIPIETSLHTLMPSNKRTHWIRVSLNELKVLSLKPLWKIKGIVQLHAKELRVTIKIDDSSLDPCILDPGRLLLCAQPDGYHTDEFLGLAKEGLIDPNQEEIRYEHHANSSGPEEAGDGRVEDRVRVTRKRNTCTISEYDEAMVTHKKHKTQTEGSHVSLDSEPKVRAQDKEQKESSHTQNVDHTNFNRGMQTRMLLLLLLLLLCPQLLTIAVGLSDGAPLRQRTPTQ